LVFVRWLELDRGELVEAWLTASVVVVGPFDPGLNRQAEFLAWADSSGQRNDFGKFLLGQLIVEVFRGRPFRLR
jgi:hypothetical protein